MGSSAAPPAGCAEGIISQHLLYCMHCKMLRVTGTATASQARRGLHEHIIRLGAYKTNQLCASQLFTQPQPTESHIMDRKSRRMWRIESCSMGTKVAVYSIISHLPCGYRTTTYKYCHIMFTLWQLREVGTHLKMSSIRQRMVIFSRSLRSCATRAGCALRAAACSEHRAS